MTMILAIWEVLLELSPWLLLGMAVAGLLHVALPEGFIHRHLGGRGGVLKAVLFGVPLPLCSCGVIPAGLGLKKDGASDGASIGFLISTPQTGVDSILVSGSFLGWPFAIFKVIAAFVTGIFGGWLTDRLQGASTSAEPAPDALSAAPPRGLRAGLEHALEVLRTIWRWIAFGVVVSAAISVYVPAGSLAGLAGYGGLLGALAVLAVSVPLYVCATASVPIAAAMVGAGMPTGAALVFLMAGPATNVATIGAIHRAFGARPLAAYLGTIIVGSVGFGLGFDAMVGSGLMPHAHAAHHGGAVAAVAAVALLALMGYFAFDDARAWLRARRPAPPIEAEPLEISITGMTCQGCVRRVRAALEETSGVTAVEVELEEGRAKIRGDVDVEELREVIRAAGFSPG